MTDFFHICGHSVTSRHCNNMERVWHNDQYNGVSDSCDHTCRTRELIPTYHRNLKCQWCRQYPMVPQTSSIRSHPGIDALPNAILLERRNYWDNYIAASRRTDALLHEASFAAAAETRAREQLERDQAVVRRRWRWEQNVEAARTYLPPNTPLCDQVYYLRYDDDVLFKSVDAGSLPSGENCPICLDSMETAICCRLMCSHTFHRQCVMNWMVSGKKCPFRCETPILAEVPNFDAGL
jgi:hypothetical protein